MIIKNPTKEMAAQLLEFVKVTFNETDNLLTAADEFNMTVEQEENYIVTNLERRLGNILVAMDGEEIIAVCGIHGREGRRRVAHIANLGITVRKAYWGQGIGFKLMEAQKEYALNNDITKISLEVRTDNESAIHLYKKCGYVVEGTNKNSMIIDGKYVDTYYMGLHL